MPSKIAQLKKDSFVQLKKQTNKEVFLPKDQ